jgi:magnesium transporter
MNRKVIDYISRGKFFDARNEIVKMNVVDIAQLLEELDGSSVLMVFRVLPKDIAVEVFSYMSYEQQQFIIESITDKEIKNIIDELFLDDTIELLEEMPANIVKKVLKNTSDARRKEINQLLKYPDNSAGSIMTIEFADLKKEMTVKGALEYIKKTGVDKETIDICYVIDSNRKLEGTIPIRKLILSSEEVVIGSIMETSVISVNTHDDQEEIATLFKKYDLVAMPVVDNENRLVGIITIDDVVDIIEREATEDFHKMAAIAPSEEEYLKTNVFTLSKHRIPWLLVLMLSATFTGGIVMKYQNLLEQVAILSAFIPMLMDTGGNAGAQSSTLIIRGIALDEIKLSDILKIVWKELGVALIVGAVLAIVNFFRVYFFVESSFLVAITVSVSLIFTVVLAKVVGGALPLIAKKLKMDPAIMAGPLITTVVDAMALLAYFAVANWLLGLS